MCQTLEVVTDNLVVAYGGDNEVGPASECDGDRAVGDAVRDTSDGAKTSPESDIRGHNSPH